MRSTFRGISSASFAWASTAKPRCDAPTAASTVVPATSGCCSSVGTHHHQQQQQPSLMASVMSSIQYRLKSIDTLKGKKTKLLADNFPNVARELDMSQNDAEVSDLKTLLQDSGKRLMWKCSVCGFSWRTSVMARTILRQGCPDCHQRDHPKLGEVSPKLVGEWSRAKNDIFVNPADVESTSKDKVWWQCGLCNVNFQARVKDRVSGHSNCPECDRGQFNHFRVNKQLLSEFHPSKNGDLTLAKLRPTDRVKVWWLCNTCGFEWQCPVGLRAGKISNSFHCPECYESSKKVAKENKPPTKRATKGSKKKDVPVTAAATGAGLTSAQAATSPTATADEFVGTDWGTML